jgi:hypothetical protein
MPRKYQLAIVGTCGLPASYGGFETLASALVENLASTTYPILVGAERGSESMSYSEWSQFVLPLAANGVSSVPYDIASIAFASFSSKVVFILGVSGAISLPFFKLIFPHVKYVVHIDGIEWARPKWGWLARVFLRLSERIAIHSSDAFIVDNQGIADYIARAYGARYLNRASLVAYGAERPTDGVRDESFFDLTNLHDGSTVSLRELHYLLVLGRAEPENNFVLIIQSFIASGLPDQGFILVIISNASSTSHGKDLLACYSSYPGILFAAPVYDIRRVQFLRRNAFAYIHGHSAGGTNPSLVEAIASERPIIAFDVPFNRYTTFGLASYFSSSQDLIDCLQFLLAEGLDILPELGRLAQTQYDWVTISADYKMLFGALSENFVLGPYLLSYRLLLRIRRKIYLYLFGFLSVLLRRNLSLQNKLHPRLPRGFSDVT